MRREGAVMAEGANGEIRKMGIIPKAGEKGLAYFACCTGN